MQYIDRLCEEITNYLPIIQHREIHSIFIGGGTPSLFSATAYEKLFQFLREKLSFENNLEITLEANPGTVEQKRFDAYRKIGINRLSLGIQSFDDEKLKVLGRIHDGQEASRAIYTAKNAGFDNINLDLMFGLPHQTTEQALSDLHKALALHPTHISWYQLTLEPNTFFYKQPPPLPEDDLTWEIQEHGQRLLKENCFLHYEVSAYGRPGFFCAHNLNYWEFGDYLGIGAGAHSKLTHGQTGLITRHWNVKNPKTYLDPSKSPCEGQRVLTPAELPLEFMMNALRLQKPIPHALFTQRTGLSKATLDPLLKSAFTRRLMSHQEQAWEVTTLGHRFLNELLELFL